MKKLNITKKQYDESKYFNNKYGSLKFVSESGKLYKTDKGVVIALESKEDDEDDEPTGLDDLGPVDGGADEEEVTVKKDDLANALQGVIDTVKDIAADNDVELPGEEEDDAGEPAGDDDEGDDEGDDEDLDELEFDENTDGDVCPECGAPMKKECSGKGCMKKECKTESARRARRANLVREAIARRARARKVRESVQRRIRAKKVLESIRRRRAQKVLESLRKRRTARKVMESLRKRRAMKRVMESRRRMAARRRAR